MKSLAAIPLLELSEPLLCVFALGAIYLRRLTGSHRMLTMYLFVRLAASVACFSVISAFSMDVHTRYDTYFYIYWTSFVVEAVLGVGIIFELYQLAMAPLPGLQRLGSLMFRWALAIATVVALGMALGGHITSRSVVEKVIFQMQQTESILTLCLVIFVAFAIRPMGLSIRSRIFGVSLGLATLSTVDLVTSAWLSHSRQYNSYVNLLGGVAFIVATTIWITYFALPEPKRQMIILPTTSPFLRWNQISLALGDAPGYVAIGGIDPAFLAPAEVEVMERASVKMDALRANAF